MDLFSEVMAFCALLPLVGLFGVLWGRNAHAHAAASESTIALTQPGTSAPVTISVRSPAFEQGQPIPDRYCANSSTTSPPLEWSGVPEEAKSLALIVEDPDASGPMPFIHWIAWNLPQRLNSLPEGIPDSGVLQKVDGALQGVNSADTTGYSGPRPPKGDPPHHYHFQLFALDRKLDLPPGTERHALLKAMEGHVLAKGELVGTYQIL